MLDVNDTAGQGCDEVDVAFEVQVVALANEARVGLFCDVDNNVTGLDTRSLIAVASELDTGAVLHAAVDVELKDLSVANRLLSGTLLAAVLVPNNLALAVAVGTGGLESLDHRTHLAHHGPHTVAVTSGAAADGALLASTAFALGADDRPLQSQFGSLTTVDVLERDLHFMSNGLSLGGSTVLHAAEHASQPPAETAPAEELGEQVLGSHAGAAAAFQASLAILIVDLTLIRIGKDLVGIGYLLELFGSRGIVRVLVCGQQLETVW